MKDPKKYIQFILDISNVDSRNKPTVLKIFSEVAREEPGIILELDPLGSEKEKIKDHSPNLQILEILHLLSVEGWDKNVDQAIQKGDPHRLENLLEALYCLNIVQNSKAYELLVQKFWEYPEAAEYLKLHMNISSPQDILNHSKIVGSFLPPETPTPRSDITINDLSDDLFANILNLVQEAPHAEGKERNEIFAKLVMNAPYVEEAFFGLYDLAGSEIPEISELALSSFEDIISRSEDQKITAVLQKGLYELGGAPQTQDRFFKALSKLVQTRPEYRWPVKLVKALAHSTSKETAQKAFDTLVQWASTRHPQALEALDHFYTQHGQEGRKLYVSAIQSIAMENPEHWWPVEILCQVALRDETRDFAFKALEEGALKSPVILRGLKYLATFEERSEVQRRALETLKKLAEKNVPGAQSVIDEIRGGKK
jgi:hypothetical protein